MSFNRRDFVKLLGSGLAAGTVLPILGRAESRPSTGIRAAAGPAKNVIFMVCDGMNLGTLSLAEQYSRYILKKPTHWMNLYRERRVVRALQETRSHSSVVTDSAAASSSWGCGQRVNNGSINFGPDQKPLTPIGVKAKNAGKAVGLVTTARITHATPAGFAANVDSRGSEDTIAAQYLDREIDLLLGGGARHFDSSSRADKRDLYAAYRSQDYTVVQNKDELAKADPSKRLLGTFFPDHLPYTIDHQRDAELQKSVPSLPEMVRTALDRLQHAPNGFLLQIEGGRIDHAAHSNDVGAIVPEQLCFDSCIPLVLDFCDKNPDTLVILTTDHGTGGCILNGEGRDYAASTSLMGNLSKITVSFECVGQHIKQGISAKQLQEQLTQLYGLSLSSDQVGELLPRLEFNPTWNNVGALLSPLLVPHTAVNWTSHNHTGELVELAAFGPGSEQISPFVENWQLHQILCRSMGIAG